MIPSQEAMCEFMKTHTNDQAATHFGVSRNTVVRWLKKHGLNYHLLKYGNWEISLEQKNMLIGSMLGDGMLRKGGRKRPPNNSGKGRKNNIEPTASFRMRMRRASLEYLEYYKEHWQPVSKEILFEEQELNGNIFESNLFSTASHPLMGPFYQEWYPQGKKIVPLNIKLNPNIVAHWFVQDGHNHNKRKTAYLYTLSFTEQEVMFLIERLFKDINIKSHICSNKKQFYIGVGAKEYFDFLSVIRPEIVWKCFAYKVDIKDAVPNETAMFPNKLTKQQAEEIRVLLDKGNMTQKEIGKKYNVTHQTISNIKRNKAYQLPIQYSGAKLTCEAKMTAKPIVICSPPIVHQPLKTGGSAIVS